MERRQIDLRSRKRLRATTWSANKNDKLLMLTKQRIK